MFLAQARQSEQQAWGSQPPQQSSAAGIVQNRLLNAQVMKVKR